MKLLAVATVLCLARPASADETRIAITDVSPAFAAGPYTALKVDPKDPQRIAVGTQSGAVSWSNDAGKTGHDSQVARNRSYQYMGFRPDDRSWTYVHKLPQYLFFGIVGGNNPIGASAYPSFAPLVSPSWNETAASTANSLQPAQDIYSSQLRGTSNFGSPSNASEFASNAMPPGDRLFMSLLNSGKPTLRWQRWMSVDDVQFGVNDVAFHGPEGKMMVASSIGIHASDRQRDSWIQSVGFPHPRRGSIQEYDPEGAGVQGTAVAIDPGDPRHVLAGTTQGLMVSTNGGESFFAHLDPKLADDPILHFIWSADNPERILALTSRSVMISKDRGKTFATALNTAADLNGLSIGQNATYAATHDGLVEVGFDGKVRKVVKDENIVGVIALAPGLVLLATDIELKVISTDGKQQPLVLKRAHPQDPFLALDGTPELSYAMTKNGVFRISATGPPPPAHGTQPEIRLSLDEVEARVKKLQRLVTPLQGRLMNSLGRIWGFIPSSVTATFFDTYGNSPTLTKSGLLSGLPFSQASGTNLSDFGFFVSADFGNLPSYLLNNLASNPLNMISQNLRSVPDDVLNQVRTHYRACVEQVTALKHPPPDPEQELLLRMRIHENAAYLEAMAGEPVVLVEDEEF